VEQIIQYSYERDKQYLTLSYMNSEFSVESYDFVTPDVTIYIYIYICFLK